jgi:8-hydroxy-5-deazaflavin:NADPH oxidoreductase
MNIAIVGTGRVAAALGKGWAAGGHTITFASRSPNDPKVRDLLDEVGANASATRIEDAVSRSSIIVLAVPFSAVRERLQQAGRLQDKVIVDCTNPIAPGLRPLFDSSTSGAEQIAGWVPGAKVVKAFNTTGSENMADPVYNGQPTTMLICGDDALAKAAVWQLADELGFEPVDTGALSAARHLESLALLWIHLANVGGFGRDIAFRLLQRVAAGA